MTNDQPRQRSLFSLAVGAAWIGAVVAMASSLSPPWAPSVVLAALSTSALALHIFHRRYLACGFAGAAVLAAGYWLIRLTEISR